MQQPTIEDAILLATQLHKGQVDKAGAPYILHPLRVMLNPILTTETERITAVLHDVVEDTEISFAELRGREYSNEIVDALHFLTKLSEEESDYFRFITRISEGPELARVVKFADLKDNEDLSRIAYPTEKDFKRQKKYQRAIEILESSFLRDRL